MHTRNANNTKVPTVRLARTQLPSPKQGLAFFRVKPVAHFSSDFRCLSLMGNDVSMKQSGTEKPTQHQYLSAVLIALLSAGTKNM
ncbi:MAG TPA: hypothetical protein VE971_04770 [Candidatus Eisenbacteria bacterium]|nr:hypothetical protein [Candidatus Eisenbacteria bacterium]